MEENKDNSIFNTIYPFILLVLLFGIAVFVFKSAYGQEREITNYELFLIEFEKDSPNEYLMYELYHAPSSTNAVVPLRSVHEVIRRVMNRQTL